MTFYHRAIKEACIGNCVRDCLEEANTLYSQLCVVMCIGIHLGSASVHNATQKGAGNSRGIKVEVMLMDDFSMASTFMPYIKSPQCT